MGLSTCVTCGECVQACPTGALTEKTLMNAEATQRTVTAFDRSVDSVCPFCGVGCQTTMNVKDDRIVQVDGRDGPANENRLCVKGRFGYDYAQSPERLTKPLIRRGDAPKRADIDLGQGSHLRVEDVFREATWDEAMSLAAKGLTDIRDEHGGNALFRLRLRQGLQRGSLPVPEARAAGLRHQQCRSLHASSATHPPLPHCSRASAPVPSRRRSRMR